MSTASAKWNKEHPDRMREINKRYDEKKRQENKTTHRREYKCVGCGVVYGESTAILNGFRFIKNRPTCCICSDCCSEKNQKKVFWDMNEDE